MYLIQFYVYRYDQANHAKIRRLAKAKHTKLPQWLSHIVIQVGAAAAFAANFHPREL